MYIHVYQIKNREPGPYNSLSHADNREYLSGLSLSNTMGSVHFSFGEGNGINLEMFLLRKR